MGTWNPGPGATPFDDRFFGNEAAESANGGAGNDTLNGGGGNDNLAGSVGIDTLFGELGNDILDGGDGDDQVYGDADLDPTPGNDILIGGAGDDILYTYGGIDTIAGGTGLDRLVLLRRQYAGALALDLTILPNVVQQMGDGTAVSGIESLDLTLGLGDDVIVGGALGDSLRGNEGNDTLSGGADLDFLYGGTGSDTLSGGDDNDVLFDAVADGSVLDPGILDDDILNGGAGDDTITSEYGFDTISGGDGVDGLRLLQRTSKTSGFIIDLSAAGQQSATLLSIFGIEILSLHGGSGADIITGGAFADLLHVGEGANVVHGGAGDDEIQGQGELHGDDGNDAIDGFAANDTIFGDAGDDVIKAGRGADHVEGGAGNDSLFDDDETGEYFDDSLLGGDGDDVITSHGSGDIVDGGAGVDTVDLRLEWMTDAVVIDLQRPANASANAPVLIGVEMLAIRTGNGNNSVTGGALRDFMITGNGNDALNGGAGDDVMFSGNGDDVVHGDAGDDLIFGGFGAGFLFGDDGNDQIRGTNAATIFGGAGNDDLGGGGKIYGEAGNDTIYDEDFSNEVLDGGDGDDVIRHWGGVDILVGGAGIDRLSLTSTSFAPGQGITFDAETMLTGTTTLFDGTAISGFESFEFSTAESLSDTVSGSVYDDVVFAGGGNDVLAGRGGSDRLFAGEGGDSVDGGDGNDLISDSDQDADFLSGGDGDDEISLGSFAGDTVNGGAGIDLLRLDFRDVFVPVTATLGGGVIFGGVTATGFERAAFMGTFANDTLTGGALADELIGGTDGSDVLRGLGGDDYLDGGDSSSFLGGRNDTLDGGDGNDTVNYAWAGGVTINLNLPGAQNTFFGGVDTLVSIENVIGSGNADALIGNESDNVLRGVGGLDLGGNDILSGNGGNDTLAGGRGSDTLDGGSGNDVISGGLGDDTLEGGDDFDIASYLDALSGVTVSLAIAGAQNTSGAGVDTLIGIENLAGSDFADTLSGNSAANMLAGGLGEDVLAGGLGDDTLDGGAGVDMASYATATSGVTVNLAAVGPQSTLGAGTDTLTSIENLLGSAFNDTLTGDAGNNVLSGAAGVDTLIGGLGDDVLIGGDNTDFIVDTSGIVSIDGGSGNEQITLGAAVVSGVVDGGVGTDQLTKGGSITGLTLIGIEILNSNGGTVTGTAAQFEGFDTIRFSAGQPFTAVSLALAAAGTVDLFDELTGRRALFAGTAGNDTITTSTGSDQIDGGAGDDTLTGNAGNDTLIGGLGDDVLSGGVGTDFLVDLSGTVSIDAGDGDDVITLGAAINAGTVAGGLGIDQLNKGGAIAGLTISGVEIVNTNGGTLLATAAQLEGFDTIRFSAAQATTAVSLALSEAGTVDLTDELLGRRALFAGTSGNDVITTSNGSDQIDGGAGDDTLTGNAGVDTLIGGIGNDTLDGGDGNDFIVDLSGTVAINGGAGDDTITVSALITAGSIEGGLGTADQLNKSGNLSGIAVSGIEIVNTNGGTLTATAAQLESFDTIRFSAAQATAAISLVQAGAGTADLTDELLGRRAIYQGSSGNDVITTSNGADRIDGGAGDDTLNGGLGNDTLTGGLGDDLIIQGSSDGRDLIDGGAGTDTYQLNGTAAAETFRVMTRAEALLAGITGLAGATEIVITKDGTDNASVIAELDNVEEIQINALLTTANNGNGTVDGGTDTGDTVIVLGDFTTTSLAYSTIHITGSLGNDTIDISGLTSAHRVVFASNGGSDTLIGDVRPQDVFAGMSGAPMHMPMIEDDPLLLQMLLGEDDAFSPSIGHTVIDAAADMAFAFGSQDSAAGMAQGMLERIDAQTHRMPVMGDEVLF